MYLISCNQNVANNTLHVKGKDAISSASPTLWTSVEAQRCGGQGCAPFEFGLRILPCKRRYIRASAILYAKNLQHPIFRTSCRNFRSRTTLTTESGLCHVHYFRVETSVFFNFIFATVAEPQRQLCHNECDRVKHIENLKGPLRIGRWLYLSSGNTNSKIPVQIEPNSKH